MIRLIKRSFLMFVLILASNLACAQEKIVMQDIRIEVFTGPQARAYFSQIANMRITLFSEYPYLYQGDINSEQAYLETYFCSANASILLVCDGDKIVGYSSSIPLIEEEDALKKPFIDRCLDLNDYLYIGEVMLCPEYRHKGITEKFFAYHENKARQAGYKKVVFMTVERSDNHANKPSVYQGLDPVWRHFGYEKSDILVYFKWKQIDTRQETLNSLAIWQKTIVIV